MAQPGDIIDMWVIEKALGQGGMGSVYRAHNKAATRILAAIKILDPAVNRTPTGRARFIREAEILYALDHPNIVKVRNIRTDAELPYIEMEFVNGESLDGRILRGPTPLHESLDLMRQATHALAYIHARGIRHRDLKPSNVLVQGDGVLKLVDFGIASDLHGEAITRSDEAFGSVSYAPPEWMDPRRLDAVKWDIYSLGLVFYELLTGQMAFPLVGPGSHRQKAMQVMIAKQNHPPLDPGPAFDDDLRQLVRELTCSDPEQRVADAAVLLARLDALVGVQSAPVVPPPAPAPGAPHHAPTWFEAEGGRPITSGATLAPAANTVYDPQVHDAPAAPAPPPAAPPPAPPAAPAVGGRPAVLLALALALLGGGALAAWQLQDPPPAPAEAPVATTRDVALVFTGLPAGTPLHATLGGRTGEPGAGTHQLRFAAVPGGPQTVEVRVGRDCAADPLPVWCDLQSHAVEVQPGEGEQLIALELRPPATAAVVVKIPTLANVKARLSLDGGEPAPLNKGLLSLALVPGRYAARVESGCAEADRGCTAAGRCPPGCVSWEGELVVPWGQPELALELAVPAPTAAPAGEATPQAPAAGGGRLVSRRQYAAWLQEHPEWLPEAARSSGLSNDRYLKDWREGRPPEGKEDAPVLYVPWSAANAFCAARGGLPPVDAAPLTWADSDTVPWMEHRQQGGRAAWRRNDGTVSDNVVESEAARSTSFRCVR